jgi:RimJ/RimL family protein N-acetyltransferase
MMFEFQPELAGELVWLRPLRAADFAALYALGADPLLWAQHPNRERATEAGFRAYFEDQLASGGALVAVNSVDEAMVGMSRYSTAFAGPDEIEIGWTFIGRAYWGGAYNRDIKEAMLAHAFRFVRTVIFRIAEHNLRSRRAVEKLGARLDVREQVNSAGPSPVRYVFYTLDREGFERLEFVRPAESELRRPIIE